MGKKNREATRAYGPGAGNPGRSELPQGVSVSSTMAAFDVSLIARALMLSADEVAPPTPTPETPPE
jgi:hypothetical protein